MVKGGGDQKSGKQNSADPIPPIETREEIAKLALRLEETIKDKARARQLETLKKGVAPVKQNSAEREHIETREEIAKLAGVSRDTVDKVKRARDRYAPSIATSIATSIARSNYRPRDRRERQGASTAQPGTRPR